MEREDEGGGSMAPPPPEGPGGEQSAGLEAALNRAPGLPAPSAHPGARR